MCSDEFFLKHALNTTINKITILQYIIYGINHPSGYVYCLIQNEVHNEKPKHCMASASSNFLEQKSVIIWILAVYRNEKKTNDDDELVVGLLENKSTAQF